MKGTKLTVLLWALAWTCVAADADFFSQGTAAYRAGDYAQAARAFRELAGREPSPGALQNLGNAEWQRGRTGHAIVAWEQALWLDSLDEAARNNLRYARKIAQLETPQLGWHEVISTWLPASWWAWITGVSLWAAVAAATLPGILRWRRRAWQHGLAALGLMVFLLSVPAQVGVHSRSRLGFVLEKDTWLRLTPTAESQAITRLAAGESARVLRARDHYLLVQVSRGTGWLERGELGVIVSEIKH